MLPDADMSEASKLAEDGTPKDFSFRVSFSGDDQLRQAIYQYIRQEVNKAITDRFEHIVTERLQTAIERAILSVEKGHASSLGQRIVKSAEDTARQTTAETVRKQVAAEFLPTFQAAVNDAVANRLTPAWGETIRRTIRDEIRALWKNMMVKEIQDS